MLSEPWKQTLRLAGLAAGNKAAWDDRTSTVVWRDTSARAFAATADALGKVAQMLGVPATELWSRIPGVSAEEVARWKQVAESQGALAELNRMLESQMTRGAQTTGPPTEAEPFQAPALGRTKGIYLASLARLRTRSYGQLSGSAEGAGARILGTRFIRALLRVDWPTS